MEDPRKTKDALNHYFLAVGEIMFVPKDAEMPSAIRLNTVITSSDGRIGVTQIARTQQLLQMQFHQKLQDAGTANVVDVVILGMIPLGVFTSEAFNRIPENMKLQERDPNFHN